MSYLNTSMVNNLIKPLGGVGDHILAAFHQVDRGAFLWGQDLSYAYTDVGIELKPGSPMMAPQVVASLLKNLNISANSHVLVVGCATGYTYSVLSHLGCTVKGVDTQEDLLNRAKELCYTEDKKSILVKENSLDKGLKDLQLFNAIVFDGAVAQVPYVYYDYLRDGGELACVLRQDKYVGDVCIFTKYRQQLDKRHVGQSPLLYLRDFCPKKEFEFC